MKYKVGDKTLLGEIVTASMGSFPYLVDGRWRFTESEIDKIIIKPKRNIDHIIELWESGKRHDAEDLYANLVDKSDSMAGDVLVLLDSYTEPSKYPQLTPDELKVVKWLMEGGYKEMCRNGTNISFRANDFWFCPNSSDFPMLKALHEISFQGSEPINLKELLDAQEVDK